MDMQDSVTSLWKLYRKGIDYQNSICLRSDLPKFVKFYEGKQWPDATQATKNLPRPVINIVKLICRIKKAALLSTPVRLVYKSDNLAANVEAFNNFATYIQKEMKLDLIDKNSVDDGVKKGSFFQHFYWDVDAVGKMGKHKGALRCELIDPLNIFFENPCCLDEQKQGWIIIVSRENVESVRARADEGVNLEEIVADERDNNAYNTEEQDKDSLCTVITRYFRQNGKVYCEKATKNVVVNKPFAIIPDVDAAKRDLGYVEDAPNNALPDNAELEHVESNESAFELYPIVAGYYEKREQCIYGLSEVEGLIPNQKAINFNVAMALLNAQEMAWGKYVVLPNALKGQKINNEPGQVLVDYTGTGGGIKKLSEQSLNNTPAELSSTIISMTRSVTGATEVMNGESIGSNMSGAAIAQLQAQAQTPIEEIRDTFWLVKQKQGLVLAQFYKHYYYAESYTFTKSSEGKETETSGFFSSAEYKDFDFSVIVEATQGTRSSVASDITLLDACLRNGNISLKTYIKAYPDTAIGNKSELLKAIDETEKSAISMMELKNKELEAKIGELTTLLEEKTAQCNKVYPLLQENERLNKALTDVAKNNQFLREMIKEFKKQANDRIKEANDTLLRMYKDTQDISIGYLEASGQTNSSNSQTFEN